MAVSAEVYFRISDALGTLRDLLDQGFMFLVPSGPDEEMLLEILLDAKPALDERPRVLRWKDLYRIIQREAPAPGIPRVSRILDPADRYLVVRWLTAGLPKQKDRCPSWIGDPLFPELAASHMVEFMREEVTQKHLFVANGCESCESCPLDSPERVLCRLFCSYQEYLRNARMADETEIPTLTRQALEAAASPPPVKLAVVGFMSFTHGQLNLLRKMIALGMELHFLFPWISLEGFNDGASQLGLSPNHPPEPLRPPTGIPTHGDRPEAPVRAAGKGDIPLGDQGFIVPPGHPAGPGGHIGAHRGPAGPCLPAGEIPRPLLDPGWKPHHGHPAHGAPQVVRGGGVLRMGVPPYHEARVLRHGN
ncbi:hypothetical protein [Thermanaerovibrio velox]|uniref:hypothetical protein n=1 Tax=Thermanaerovibrio velox TaxID=108007 RepID=UPI0012EA3E96|nr:hypothetical protein [Thermanaerovibrio velox]